MEKFYTLFFVAGIGCFVIAAVLSLVFPWMTLNSYHGMDFQTLEDLAAQLRRHLLELLARHGIRDKGRLERHGDRPAVEKPPRSIGERVAVRITARGRSLALQPIGGPRLLRRQPNPGRRRHVVAYGEVRKSGLPFDFAVEGTHFDPPVLTLAHLAGLEPELAPAPTLHRHAITDPGRTINDPVAVFVIGSFLVTIPLQFYYNYTNWFLSQIGVAEAVGKMTYGQMSEIFFMLLMPLFLARLGVKYMLLVAMACWASYLRR